MTWIGLANEMSHLSKNALIPPLSSDRVPPELRPPHSDPEHLCEADLEADLMSRLADHRRRLDVSKFTPDGDRRDDRQRRDVDQDVPLPRETRWDLALSHLLMPALEAYEQVRDGKKKKKNDRPLLNPSCLSGLCPSHTQTA